MHLRERLKDRATLTRVGMSLLILASLARWFLHPNARLSPFVVDGVTGLLYGLSIGCLLLSLRARPRAGQGGRAEPRG